MRFNVKFGALADYYGVGPTCDEDAWIGEPANRAALIEIYRDENGWHVGGDEAGSALELEDDEWAPQGDEVAAEIIGLIAHADWCDRDRCSCGAWAVIDILRSGSSDGFLLLPWEGPGAAWALESPDDEQNQGPYPIRDELVAICISLGVSEHVRKS